MGIKSLAGSFGTVFVMGIAGYAAYDAYPTIKRKFIETKNKIATRKEKIKVKFN